MARDQLLSAIDIGTSKICTLVATANEDASIHVLGVSTVPSKGLRKGQVVNIEEATSAISVALEATERMAGTTIAKACVSVGGAHIASLNSHGVVAVADPDKEITTNDVRRVIDAAKAVSLPSSREILHVLPRGYVVDGQEGIVDPIGMTGVRLEVDTHLVTGGATAIRNIYKCVEELGVEIVGLVFGGLASSFASLSETEKELGVVLIDIGGGTTDIAIYVEGALAYSSVIPIGAINITKDLAAGLRVSLESAEKIKLALGDLPKIPTLPFGDELKQKKVMSEDELDLRNIGIDEEMKTVSKKTLVEGIIKPRLNEIFTMAGLEIKRSGFGGMTPSGVVLAGGGALTTGALESARRNLAMPVHVGMPMNVTGLIDEIKGPAFAASIGLLSYATQMKKTQTGYSFAGLSKISQRVSVKGVAGRLIDLVKSFLP